MKAARFSRFGRPEVLGIVEIPDPHPGPGQIRVVVGAAGVNASDWKKRRGLMDQELPQTMGYEAAGIVDEQGHGVTDVAIGDRVFGFCIDGAAQAELAVLAHYAPMPSTMDFSVAASLPAAIETPARALDLLGVAAGDTLLINGASGNVGSAAVQLAVDRGARVIGIASPGKQDFLRSLGAVPVAYGAGMTDRVKALTPQGIDLALDVTGNGVLPELIDLAGPGNVVTVADCTCFRRLVSWSAPDGSSRRSCRLSRLPRSPRRSTSANPVARSASSCCSWIGAGTVDLSPPP